MSKALYLHDSIAIINYNEGFPQRNSDILNSESFKKLCDAYVDSMQHGVYSALQEYIIPGQSLSDAMVPYLRELLVTPIESVTHPFSNHRDLMLEFVEGVYAYWRSYQRCSLIYINKHAKSELVNFLEKDDEFNQTILRFYRVFQEKLQGRKNKVYRQLQAGTNAAITVRKKRNLIPEPYYNLKGVGTIDSILLRSPLLLHPKTNKREGHFEEVFENPIKDLELDPEVFFCYPAKVGTKLALVYLHRDFVFSGVSLANLFEMATTEEIETTKPDILIVFGCDDGTDDMVFYNDLSHEVVVAKIAYSSKIEYFGYMKKIILTAYNVSMMNDQWLPIHGAMVNVYLKNKRKVGVVFMGDSGAGKSEIIEEISSLGSDLIEHIDVIFDDMGVFHVSNNVLMAQGTEVGAFVRLDDLDRSLPYQAMDRSIFMNPESVNNARVIVPVSDYRTIASDHRVDYFLYANNYEDQFGVELFSYDAHAKDVFIQGKRMAKATTHEVGITTSFFANPFGPLQQQARCTTIIDEIFSQFEGANVKVGQVFTRLGIANRGHDDLKKSAHEVLALISKEDV